MPSKTNYKDFSARVKVKYPEYGNMDDLSLAKMWVEQNPQYGEFVVFDEPTPQKKSPVGTTPGQPAGSELVSSGDPIADRAQTQSAIKGYAKNKDKAEEIGYWENLGLNFANGSNNFFNNAFRTAYEGSLAMQGVPAVGIQELSKYNSKPLKEDFRTKTRQDMGLLEESTAAFANSLPIMLSSMGLGLATGVRTMAGKVAGALPSFISGFQESGREADEIGIKDPLDRLAFQTAGGGIEAVSEFILPDASLIRPLRQRALKDLVRVGSKGLSKADVGRYVAEFTEKVAKEIGEEYAVEVGQALRGVSFAVAGYDSAMPEMKSARDYAVMTLSAAIGAGTFGGVGTLADAAYAQSSAIKKASENPEAAAQAVADLIDAGKLTEEQGSEFLTKVNMLSRTSSRMPKNIDPEVAVNSSELLNQKMDIEEQINALEEEKKGVDDSFVPEIDTQIASLTEQLNALTQQISSIRPTELEGATIELDIPDAVDLSTEDQSVLDIMSSRFEEPYLNAINQRINNAEEISLSELENIAGDMINELTVVSESQDLTDNQKQQLSQLVENQIDNLLNYEFATTTTTEQAGQKTKAAGIISTPREGRPLPESKVSRERFEGAGVRIGGRGAGRIAVKRIPGFGGRSVYGVSFGNRKGVSPVEDLEFDNLEFVAPEILADGSFNARVKDSKSGLEFTITDPELSIDLAIAAQLKEAGRKEFPQPAFLEAVREVTQGQPTQVTTFPNLGRTGTTPAAVGVEPQTEQDVRQETNAPQEGRGQGEDAAPVPQEEGRQEGQVTPPAVAQEGETPPATAKKPRKTAEEKADEGRATLEKLKETLRALRAKPGGGANIDLTFGVVPITKAVWNTAIDTAILAIEAGQSIAQAVKAASDYISSKIDGDWGKAKFEQYMDDRFSKSSPKPKAVFHAGTLDGKGNIYVSPIREQANEYSSMSGAPVLEFEINENAMAPESEVRDLIRSLGLKLPEGYNLDELFLYEALDTRVKSSLSQGDIDKLYAALKDRGYEGISFRDEDIRGVNREGIDNFIVFDKSSLSEQQARPEAQVEATAKALDGVDTQPLKRQLGIEANWDMIGEGDTISGKDPVLAYIQKQLPGWNRESQRGNINPNSKITYDVVRGEYGGIDQKDVVEAKDENGVVIGVVKLDTKGGIENIAVAPEFRGKGVSDKLIQTLKENNPQLDLSKTKLRSKGFEKAFGNKIIAEAYHKAKSDGSNPELVQAVEDLLGQAAPEAKPEVVKQGSRAFFESVKAAFPKRGMFGGVVITDADGTELAEVSLQIKDDERIVWINNEIPKIELSSFLSLKAGSREGFGKRALSVMKDMADKHGVQLLVYPEPLRFLKIKGVNKKFLERFYGKNGFKSPHRLSPYMVYLPQTPEVKQEGVEESISDLKGKALSLVDQYNYEMSNFIERYNSFENSIYDKFEKSVKQEINNIVSFSKSLEPGDAEILPLYAKNIEQAVDLITQDRNENDNRNFPLERKENYDNLTDEELKSRISKLEGEISYNENRYSKILNSIGDSIYGKAEKALKLEIDELSSISKSLPQDAGKVLNGYVENIKKAVNSIKSEPLPLASQQQTPEAKPEKTIAEQRKEFRETAKKYFEGMKKMGVIFDAERNAKEDIAFLKALKDYIKLEIDNGMVTFKGFIEKASAIMPEFSNNELKGKAKELWGQAVVKEYPKLMAKYSKVKQQQLEEEIKAIKESMVKKILFYTNPENFVKKDSVKLNKIKISKEAQEQLRQIGSVISKNVLMSDESSPLFVKELLDTVKGIYETGNADSKAAEIILDKQAEESGRMMEEAIASTNLKKREVSHEEAARRVKSGVVTIVADGETLFARTKEDVDSFKDYPGAKFYFLNNRDPRAEVPDISFMNKVKRLFFEAELIAKDFITRLDDIKSVSKKSQEYINDLNKRIVLSSAQRDRIKNKWSEMAKNAQKTVFKSLEGYSKWAGSNAEIKGKSLSLKTARGGDISRVSNGEVFSWYMQIRDARNLLKTGKDKVRKINLSDESISKIIEYVNLPENANFKEFAKKIDILFKGMANDISETLEANGYDSSRLLPKSYSKKEKGEFAEDNFISETMDKLSISEDGDILYYPVSATEDFSEDPFVDLTAGQLSGDDAKYRSFSVISNNMYPKKPGGQIIRRDVREVLGNYIPGMANMSAKLPLLRETQKVFSKSNMNAIESAFGETFAKKLKNDYVATMTDRQVEGDTGAFSYAWLTTQAAVNMFFNLASALYQPLAGINFVVDYGVINYIKAAKKLFSDIDSDGIGENLATTLKELYDLPTVRERYGQRFSIDVKSLSNNKYSFKVTAFGNTIDIPKMLTTALRYGYRPIAFMDILTITLFGAPIYYDTKMKELASLKKEGLSDSDTEVKAKKKSEDAIFFLTNLTQQSSESALLSGWQRNKFSRLFTTFTTAVAQNFRQGYRAINRIKNKEGSQIDNSYAVFHYTIITAVLFQAVSTMLADMMTGSDDDDEVKKFNREKRMSLERLAVDVAATVAQSTGAMGTVLQAAILGLKSKYVDKQKNKDVVYSATRTMPTINAKIRTATEALNEIDKENWGKATTKSVQFVTNVPLEETRKRISQLNDALFANLDAQERILRVLGFINEQRMDEKRALDIFNDVGTSRKEASTKEIEIAISDVKSDYRELFKKYGEDYAKAETEDQKKAIEDKANKELSALEEHKSGGAKFAKELVNAFNESSSFYSIPKDMQKLSKKSSDRKVGDVAEECLRLLKKDKNGEYDFTEADKYLNEVVGYKVLSQGELDRVLVRVNEKVNQ